METLKTIWDFFQNEILGMAWLNRLIGSFLDAFGTASLMFTVDGEILETGHVIYDFPLEAFQ